MKLTAFEKLGLGAIGAYLGLLIAFIAGYITNIVWMFRNLDNIGVEFAVALVGAFVFPLGALHGIWTWF